MDLRHIAELIWLVLPAYAANMAPPFVKYWKGWNRPISERHLGTHKTVVGFSFGVAVALVTAWAQHAVEGLASVEWAWWQVGLVEGVGAMAGDAIKSFCKRRRGIPPGARWIPADQLDFMIGAIVLSAHALALSVLDILIILVLTFLGHIVVNHVARALHIRDTAW
jgi:CDP-2,3-bis-(O-geranylgeranyl)-sn-glycerol synthase